MAGTFTKMALLEDALIARALVITLGERLGFGWRSDFTGPLFREVRDIRRSNLTAHANLADECGVTIHE